MTGTTVIRDADWVVAFDTAAGSHVYRHGLDLAFAGGTFTHVGAGYRGPADSEIDGRGLMVMPGLINIHTHPSSEPGNKGLLEELGSPRLGQSSLYEFMPVFRIAPEAAPVATRVALAELLKSGVTTVVDLSGVRPGWADELAASGIRAVICPMYRSATWRTRDGHSVEYSWDEAAGRDAFAAALAAVDAALQHPSGRIGAMLGPAQLDTCSDALLKDSLAAARERGVALQIHAAQSVVEFTEITRRHGRTPIEQLDHLGLLDPDTIIGHGIFLNDHPWIHWPQADDFGLLAGSGASVAHCPTVFVRRGIALNTIHRYRAAGINLGIGCDTFPLNMIDELRQACYAARVLAGDFTAASTREVFEAATLGGARALKRDDIGRIAIGAKADFSLVDLGHPAMQPLRDPLRSLIYSASDRPIRSVYVGGVEVVSDGAPLNLDPAGDVAELGRHQREALAGVAARDWAGRSLDEMTPLVFPLAV